MSEKKMVPQISQLQQANAAPMTAAQQRQQRIQANLATRNFVLSNSVDMLTQIFSQAVDPTASPNPIIINFLNVGLIKGFYVLVKGTIANTDGAIDATLTNFGASNLLSNIVLTDYSNVIRIQTTGWHMAMINSAKEQLVFGGAYAPNIPIGFGNNYTVDTAPATIAHGTEAAVQFFFWVPAAYSKTDLRGAIWGGVTNATAQLTLTLNLAPCTATANDPTLAVYRGPAAAACGWKAGTKVTITVWQNYLDQVPRDPQTGQPVLPAVDMNTIYELRNTAFAAIVAGQDFNMPFSNFRTFVSVFAIYDNGGVLNAGSDINYWAMRAANTTQLFQIPPSLAALKARRNFQADPPTGGYYFDFRDRPINTQQFGNMNLVLNTITAAATAAVLVGWEDFADATLVGSASAIASS